MRKGGEDCPVWSEPTEGLVKEEAFICHIYITAQQSSFYAYPSLLESQGQPRYSAPE